MSFLRKPMLTCLRHLSPALLFVLAAPFILIFCQKMPEKISGKAPPVQANLATFGLEWTGQALIVRSLADNRSLFESVPGRIFVEGAKSQASFEESRGMFFIEDENEYECHGQSVEEAGVAGEQFTIKGSLLCPEGAIAYELSFIPVQERLQFRLALSGELNRARLVWKSHRDEGFFGFGEQFTYFNLKGRLLPVFVMEQGVGRGAQPITIGADVQARAGGKWHTSYAGIPHFISSDLRSLFLENYEYSLFDFRAADSFSMQVMAPVMQGQIVNGNSPAELVRQFTAYSGRMRPLPDWINKGAIIGMQGGTEKVRKVLADLQQHKTPLAAFWLQDWVGQRRTTFGKQLWWNWILDKKHYPGWDGLVADLKQENIRLLLYVNPFLADVSQKDQETPNQFLEAQANGCLLKNKAGQTYLILNTSFSAGLLDLSSERCGAWIKGIIKRELIGNGASGWMADFGEALPMDAVLEKGSPEEFHNRYPEEWARLNREAIGEAGREGDIVFFSRSGYTRSPQYSTLFWLGDQLVSWDHHDGIKTAVTGLLSSGLSGYSLNHSDIGGYTTITNPIANYHRSGLLLKRWIELAAFTAVFRTHEGNRPDENAQIYSSPELLAHFSKFARVFQALAPYRTHLMQDAAGQGWPLVRPMFFHYPEERAFWNIDYQQFMLGPDLLVAPVLDESSAHVRVHLPPGSWIHAFSGQEYHSKNQVFMLSAPVGSPAVFYKSESEFAPVFQKIRSAIAL